MPAARRSSIAAIRDFSRAVEEKTEEEKNGTGTKFQKHFFSTWSWERKVTTVFGCCSSCIVLGVRLWLDHYPTAYLLHSIIVFFDMILIHIFSRKLWMSVTGEMITIAFFLSFHYTKESVFEMFETVLIAIVASINLIASRTEAITEKEELQDEVDEIKRRGSILVHNISQVQVELARIMEEDEDLEAGDTDEDDGASDTDTDLSDSMGEQKEESHGGCHRTKELFAVCRMRKSQTKETTSERIGNWLDPNKKKQMMMSEKSLRMKRKAKACGDAFFEYFLDGAAGVMYTSFLGLIIDGLINYGNSPYAA